MNKIYNNEFYCSSAILLILIKRSQWKVSEIVLILPLVTQKRIVDTVNLKRRKFSIFDLVVDKPELFYNFNIIFKSFLNTTLNGLSILIYSKLITFRNNVIYINEENINYEMINRIIKGNKRLISIQKNSGKIAELIQDKSDIEELYTILGVIL